MNKNLTDITLVVDRSGSMHRVRADAEGGINSLIAEQQKQEGTAARLTLIEFNNESRTVFESQDVNTVSKYSMHPAGGTALFDAVGMAIQKTGERLKAMPEAERPGVVIIAIVTDGEENSSREFSKEQVREMVEHQNTVYNWKFQYLGANQDAFVAGRVMGIPAIGTQTYNAQNSMAAYKGISNSISRMRAAGASGQMVSEQFTSGEIQAMVK